MKNKGISLIVLIITIVVIIILATAIIVNLAQTNIIGNANEATVKQDFKTMQEELSLHIADEYANTRGALDVATIDASTEDEVKAILKSSSKSKYIEYVTIVDGKIVISETAPSDIKEWANEAINSTSAVIPSTPTTPSTPVEPEIGLDNINGTTNSSITGGVFLSTNPVIPVGFKTSNNGASWSDSDNNGIVDGWNDGLVIVDASGNEFVWVPCTTNTTDTSKIQYTKRFSEYPKHSSITSVSNVDTEVLPMKSETEYVTETDQINRYGGFYIGRYEAGVPANQTTIDGTSKENSNTTGIPTIQQGATVWTYINYTNANTNAKSFINTPNVKSGLVTGTQWDTVCAWINSETNDDGTPVHSVTNSVTWGNYSNTDASAKYDTDGTTQISGSKQTAGKSENWKAKNIYDLAGNTYEWTGESYSSYRIYRGGYYVSNGSTRPASYRYDSSHSLTYDDISFRLSLYIM